ncbi:MAG: hypothetical protein QM647_16385 [Asticcacaulis sp.]|uniref:S10 family serine carboxypeptidase-like protein n=1 Tax=Asticcacaulis sp. TaxID=1872648 RepID=UPI0039E6F412
MRVFLIATFALVFAGQALADTPPPAENAVTTTHSVTVNGRALPYKAAAGNLILRDADGAPTASVFYVAYTVDQPKGAAPRPVTFLFNGGPGSASLWLHMSGLGPVTVHTNTPNPTGPAPYDVAPSGQTLLDKTDLVFIDAIGTGFSHALGETRPGSFWGVDQDAAAFTQTITRYLTVNKRWGSPKFLFGESYGTTRAAALAYQLQNKGVQINGVVLLSSILDFSPLLAGQDQASINALPTYAMVAAYHGRSTYTGD